MKQTLISSFRLRVFVEIRIKTVCLLGMLCFFRFTSLTGKEAAPDLELFLDHSQPTFSIYTDSDPEKILWQISDGSETEPTIVEKLTDFNPKIQLEDSLYSSLNSQNIYFFRFKVKKENCWSDWSYSLPFEVPHAQTLGCKHVELVSQYPHISAELLQKIKPYLLPEDHPVKVKLDKIFSKSRALLSIESMKKAGFIKPYPRKFTRLVVTKHPDLTGFIIKTYLDAQRYHKDKPEHYFWISRLKGAKAIQDRINKQNLQGLFKVPRKWIYILPQDPSPPKEHIRKNFILVEEDMDLLNDKENKSKWKSNEITPEFLNIVFLILEDIGLHDCAKPDNIPFSKDGKVAFIDTQSYHEWPVNYKKLTPFLSSKMKKYWKALIKKASK